MRMYIVSILHLFLLVSVGCAMHSSRVVTMRGYLQVENGESREALIERFGEPISVEVFDNGMEVLKYVERFSLNGEVVEARYYYFYVKRGKVVGKVANVVDKPVQIDSTNM